jgi:TonB-dependent receptor
VNEETGEVDSTFWQFSGRAMASRLFSETDDDEEGVEGHITIPFQAWAGREARLKLGGLTQRKDRKSWTRRFTLRPNGGALTAPPDSLLQDAFIGGSLQFTDATRGTDFYWADQSVDAWYAMIDLPLTQRFRMQAGARAERARQSVSTYAGDVFNSDIESFGNDDMDWMPSLNLTRTIGRSMNLRFSASQTVSRPDLRELTNYDQTNYFSGANETGNPDLKRAVLQSYDFRWEVFPTLDEMVSVSLFYKKLKGPIEKTLQGGESPRIFPANGEDGRNLGMELELRTSLGRLWSGLSRFGVNANVTLVDSEVEVPSIGVESSKIRPLEGQSPYVLNLALYYASRSGGTEVSAFYNRYGRRLSGVGIQGQPDVFDRPQASLDLTATRRLAGSMKLKMAVKNLTNEDQVVEQGDRIRELYRSGVSWAMGLSLGS